MWRCAPTHLPSSSIHLAQLRWLEREPEQQIPRKAPQRMGPLRLPYPRLLTFVGVAVGDLHSPLTQCATAMRKFAKWQLDPPARSTWVHEASMHQVQRLRCNKTKVDEVERKSALNEKQVETNIPARLSICCGANLIPFSEVNQIIDA